MKIKPCLCGAMPIVEKKINKVEYDATTRTYLWEQELSKYHCPNCKNKELPWIDSRDYPRIWNDIALKKSYHKRTLAYNYNGVCIDEPFIIYEYNQGTKIQLKIKFYLDNFMYYYCFNFWYKHHGGSGAMSISSPCFHTMEKAKLAAKKELYHREKKLLKIVNQLFAPKQMELF